MKDPRLEQIAQTICNYSLQLESEQNLLIRGNYLAKPLMKEVAKYAAQKGVNVYFEILDDELTSACMINSNEQRAHNTLKWSLPRYEEMHAFLSLRAVENDYEMKNIPDDIRIASSKILRPLSDLVVKSKWVILDYPTYGLAQNAKMPYDEFYDFVMDVCSIDYKELGKRMEKLKAVMDKTDKVRIVGKGTDITFSIKGINTVVCSGENNIPDGEVFTAPVKDSVNGVITYNVPSPHSGKVYNDVSLTFENGKIVNATASNDVESLNKIFSIDEGAKFVGEFAIGVNPKIMNPMGNILFDEKIAGSFHFTPGQAYDDADNGNRSALHWDLVSIQREDFGGGQIYFDDVLIRDNGIFVIEELKCLNWDQF